MTRRTISNPLGLAAHKAVRGQRVTQTQTKIITTVLVCQPLALPGSANYDAIIFVIFF